MASQANMSLSLPGLSSRLLHPFRGKISVSGDNYACSRRKTTYFYTRCIQGLSPYTISTTEWPEITFQESGDILQVLESNDITQRIDVIRSNICSINDGELSISAYDTAWVALVRDVRGSDAPQFPSSLEWIVNNQLPDGSWGDPYFFSPYDRLGCTLACVVALRTWNIFPEQIKEGISFLRLNLPKLKDEDPEHMPSGFEVRFPSLIGMAHNLGLEILDHCDVLQDLDTRKELKLKRIPKEMLHKVPTTLLYSLEGMPDLDWDMLLKLQHPNGSFLCSPASTAYALMQTKDEKCLKFLRDIVNSFKGGVPHCYPVDIFERLWVVDRLERLGISRYFMSEIRECLDYVYRHWTPNGISWSRDTVELDIDDTSMAFRLLRLHGYEVEANAFRHFEKDGQFFCFLGQTSQGVTEMLSLYRASQISFPGDKILEEANKFTSAFLREKQNLGQVADRWIISKDLAGEVQYSLDVPWYASLPRLETRHYIDQYGGDNDVWIGKVLYRMHNVSNNLYLDLAKLDYNQCQKLHHEEWIDIQRWYNVYNLRDFGLKKDELLNAYFVAMASIYEPERATERIAWAKTSALIDTISFYFKLVSVERRRSFVQNLTGSTNQNKQRRLSSKGHRNGLEEVILKTLRDISSDVRTVHQKEIFNSLKHTWQRWLLNWEYKDGKHVVLNNEAEILVYTLLLCSGHSPSIDLTSQSGFINLTNLTKRICNRLRQIQYSKAAVKEELIEELAINLPTESVDQEMEKLLQQVIKSNDDITQEIKQTFLTVAKSYYYSALCNPDMIDLHITKVLFDRIL